MDNLLSIVAILIILSIAAERLVEITKGIIPFLSEKNDDPNKERWRKVILQAMAVVAGIVVALLVQPAIAEVAPGVFQSTTAILALGLLASGGSGLWNVILTYLLKVKDLKALDIQEEVEKLIKDSSRGWESAGSEID